MISNDRNFIDMKNSNNTFDPQWTVSGFVKVLRAKTLQWAQAQYENAAGKKKNKATPCLSTAEPWGVGTPPAVRKQHQQFPLVGVGHAQSRICFLHSKSTMP